MRPIAAALIVAGHAAPKLPVRIAEIDDHAEQPTAFACAEASAGLVADFLGGDGGRACVADDVSRVVAGARALAARWEAARRANARLAGAAAPAVERAAEKPRLWLAIVESAAQEAERGAVLAAAVTQR